MAFYTEKQEFSKTLENIKLMQVYILSKILEGRDLTITNHADKTEVAILDL